jgi:DNA replication and repair protein RecF
MFLKKLSLVNFKNYETVDLDLSSGVNAFTGGNGEGKTNLLDAIHYLAMCKSYFNSADLQNVKRGEDLFVLQGVFDHLGVDETISCGFKKGQKKVLKRNQKEYDRLADHIGFIPVVMISPTDVSLITDGSEDRRRFLDSIVSQFDRVYLEDLISYGRVISQRNAYLKQAHQSRKFDNDSLMIWDEQLIPIGNRIHAVRQKFIEELIPIFARYYDFISGGKESIDIKYDSDLNENSFTELLQKSLEKDRVLQYTTSGTHRDDLIFMINGFPVKKVCFTRSAEILPYRNEIGAIRFHVAIEKYETDIAARRHLRKTRRYQNLTMLFSVYNNCDLWSWSASIISDRSLLPTLIWKEYKKFSGESGRM